MIINREYIAITCINSKIDVVKNDVERILKNSDVCEISKDNFRLPEQPYTPKTMSATIWEPLAKLNSTMLMANFSDGWLSLANILATEYKHELFRLRISSPQIKWPVCSMIYYKDGKKRRIIQALKDDPRWEFFEQGELLYFENPENYRKRKIKDRFNKSILLEYLNESGWNLQNDKMWSPKKIGYIVNYK